MDGRYLVEIESWEPAFHVGLSSEATAPEHRFQGGLNYRRSFEITGRIVASKAQCGQKIRVWLSSFGADLQFGRDSDTLDEVGQLHFRKEHAERPPVSATLLIPESSLTFVAAGLASA